MWLSLLSSFTQDKSEAERLNLESTQFQNLWFWFFFNYNIVLYNNDNEYRSLVAVGFEICFIDFYRRHISLASNQICWSPSFRSAWLEQLSWWCTLMCWWATCCKLQLSYWFNSCYICNLPLLKCKIGFLVLKWYNMPNSLIPYFLAQVRSSRLIGNFNIFTLDEQAGSGWEPYYMLDGFDNALMETVAYRMVPILRTSPIISWIETKVASTIGGLIYLTR